MTTGKFQHERTKTAKGMNQEQKRTASFMPFRLPLSAMLLCLRALVVLSVAALITTSGVVRTASAHKFHASFVQVDYNAKTQSAEITLRTFPDDLEAILTRRAGKSVALERKDEAGALALAYLRDTFQLQSARGVRATLTWVGMDAGVDSAWLYFEAKLPGGLSGARLSDQYFFDLFDDQVNVVNLRDGDNKQSLTFERGGGFQTVPAQ